MNRKYWLNSILCGIKKVLKTLNLVNTAVTLNIHVCPPVYFIGAAEEWVLQGADQIEGQGRGGERSGSTGQGVWGRSGGDTCKDFGQGPCSHHQLWQAGDQRRPHQHCKHIPAWLLDAQEIDRHPHTDWDCSTV